MARCEASVFIQLFHEKSKTVTHKSEVQDRGVAAVLKLTRAERTELQHQAEARNDRADAARHARLILLLHEGLTWAEIRERLDCSDSYIARWSKRFVAERLAGLYARHAGRERYKVTDRLENRVLKRTTERTPADGSRHWSSRKLADELGGAISHMTVARIWAKHGIKPHRLQSCLASSEPAFDASNADVVGLYLNQPQHAAVFNVPQVMRADEEHAAGQTENPQSRDVMRGHSGLRALAASIKTQVDDAPRAAPARHTSSGFAAFLADILAHRARGEVTHVIADNASTRKSRAVSELLADHPGLTMHFAPTYAAWLHQVESCLAMIERDLSAHDNGPPMHDVRRHLMRQMRRSAQRPRPFKWKLVPPSRVASKGDGA